MEGDGKEKNERKILRYAQNDNCNAVNAKESHNFPYLCRTPKPNPNQTQTKPKPKPTKAQSSNPKTAPKAKNTLPP